VPEGMYGGWKERGHARDGERCDGGVAAVPWMGLDLRRYNVLSAIISSICSMADLDMSKC
jgi:hypothetical protein